MSEEANPDRNSKLKDINTNYDSLPSNSAVGNTHIYPSQTIPHIDSLCLWTK